MNIENLDKQTLDTKVLSLIGAHAPIRFGEICGLLGVSTSDGKRYRPVDNSVRRLRTRGLIEFRAGKWSRTAESIVLDPTPKPQAKDPPVVPLPHQW